ncbi:MAG: sigma-70 family RNA polymerase sigma factor [Oscillospiraceae bacterium]|nr:sigma-70 family RNA polymerase sigma factor [Oscillospiraceae bacterium]
MIALFLHQLGTPAEKSKFRKLYELYCQNMYSVAYQILKDAYLSEDAVHNAFLRVSGCLDRIGAPEEKSSRNYLLIIARNEAIRIYQQNQKQFPVEEFEENIPDLQNIELETESREVRKQIFELIRSLEPIYADILMLKFRYELEDEEIAHTLGITIDNARVRLHRARNKLKRKLSEVYKNE